MFVLLIRHLAEAVTAQVIRSSGHHVYVLQCSILVLKLSMQQNQVSQKHDMGLSYFSAKHFTPKKKKKNIVRTKEYANPVNIQQISRYFLM